MANEINMIHQTLKMRQAVRRLKAAHKRPAGALRFNVQAPTASWSGVVTAMDGDVPIDAKFIVEFAPNDLTKIPVAEIGLDYSLGHTGDKIRSDDRCCFAIYGLPPNGNHPRWQINFTCDDQDFNNNNTQEVSFTVAVFSQLPGTVSITRTL